MTEAQARQRALDFRALAVPAIARATPAVRGWPNVSETWEVALRDTATGRYLPEYDSRVYHKAQRLPAEE